MARWKKKVTAAAAVLVVLGLLAVIVLRLVYPPYGPSQRALALIREDGEITVRTESYGMVFLPGEGMKDTGMIVYPGGNVDYRAYSYWGQRLARAGYPVVIVRMPLHLAVLAPNRAGRVIDDLPEVAGWVLGGHSLGGAMAGRYAVREDVRLDGLILMGSYVDRDLRQSGLPVLSLLGSRDGVISQQNLEQGRTLLPEDVQWMVLEGGNHAYFGDYGLQRGDHPAKVSFDQQQDWAVREVLLFLDKVHTGH